jgi:hypothetical protein
MIRLFSSKLINKAANSFFPRFSYSRTIKEGSTSRKFMAYMNANSAVITAMIVFFVVFIEQKATKFLTVFMRDSMRMMRN